MRVAFLPLQALLQRNDELLNQKLDVFQHPFFQHRIFLVYEIFHCLAWANQLRDALELLRLLGAKSPIQKNRKSSVNGKFNFILIHLHFL